MEVLVGVRVMAVERVWIAEPAQAPPAADGASPHTNTSPPTVAEERGEKKSIAVLPFVNISSDPEQEYFADGMTEELLNVLAKVPLLQVAARTSVFEFKGKSGDVREIGARLGVGHIVEGSVRRDGGQVRVTAQLVRVADGFHVWSDSYDRELKNVFALQEDIARHIAAELKTSLVGVELPAARAAIPPAAYDEYLRGRALYRQRRDLPLAIAHLEAAVDETAEFAAGWSTLSLAREVAIYFTTPSQYIALGDTLSQMRAAAQQAAKYEPGAAMTLHAMANVARSEGRFSDAEQLYCGPSRRIQPTRMRGKITRNCCCWSDDLRIRSPQRDNCWPSTRWLRFFGGASHTWAKTWKEMLDRFGFVAYWREKGWPPLCRPLGESDFECGRFAAVTK